MNPKNQRGQTRLIDRSATGFAVYARRGLQPKSPVGRAKPMRRVRCAYLAMPGKSSMPVRFAAWLDTQGAPNRRHETD